MNRFLILALLLFSSVPTSAAPASVVNCSTPVTSLSDPLTAAVWQQLTADRASAGLPAFAWSDTLSLSAAWMARDSAQRMQIASTVDSLGRDVRARATDCGYRTDAQVRESLAYSWGAEGYQVWSTWKGTDPIGTYWIINSSAAFPPTYTVGALGRYRGSNGADFWVLDVGTLGGAPPPPPPPTPTPTPMASWIFCAGEGQFCAFSGTREVRYGADTRWTTRTATNQIACTNDVFGDPAFGTRKQCESGN